MTYDNSDIEPNFRRIPIRYTGLGDKLKRGMCTGKRFFPQRETRLEGNFTWAKKGTGMNAATGSQRRMSDIMASWPRGVTAGSYDSSPSDPTRCLNSLSFSIMVQE